MPSTPLSKGKSGLETLMTCLFLIVYAGSVQAARPAGEIGKDWGNPKGDKCVECHWAETPGLTEEWNNSQHGQRGVNCLDCHAVKDGDKDGFKHEGEMISIIVTPKDCSKCHTTEFQEMDGSHHAKGGQILASLDNLLGEVVGGPAAVNVGCRQCHGAEGEIGKDGKPTPPAMRGTGSPRPRLARPIPAANAMWGPTIPRSKSTTNPNTASSIVPRSTR